jgi:tetratricopeptide (TPR) repeat protein
LLDGEIPAPKWRPGSDRAELEIFVPFRVRRRIIPLMTSQTGEIVRGLAIIGVFVVLAAFVIVWSVRKAEDPARMVFRWLLTIPVVAFMIRVVAPMVGAGGYGGAFVGIPLAAVSGLVLAIIWRQSIATLFSKPFTALYDGGSEPPIPHPAYSVALARQKRGRYMEAVTEIRQQLERFPTDVEGQLLLAQIQAEDLKDLPGAEVTIQRFCAQPGHAPQNIVFALYSMADWHLRFGRDREAAQRSLEQVIELLPDSEFALSAAQRIAHLGTTEMLLAPEERKKFIVAQGIKYLGLARGEEPAKPPEKPPGEQAADYVKHLELHPLDTEAREELAVIYADHYRRLDLAADQLEEMIQQPHQPGRLVARWLNLLADLQVRGGADYETVRQTLQRIIDRDPNLAAADIARRRLELLKLEFKANEQSRDVEMGAYEQDIGLKHGRPPRNPPA